MRYSIILIFILIIYPAFSQISDEEALRQEIIRIYEEKNHPIHPEDLYGYGFQFNVRRYKDQISPGLKSSLNKIMQVTRPERQEIYISPSGRFTLYYDISGTHAVPLEDFSQNGIPDYIDSAAVFLDYVWQVEIDELGFRPPPDINGDPLETYPIYFTNFSSNNLYGLTNFENEIPSLPGENYTSFIELHHNFQDGLLYTKGLDGMRVTCAHEFNHALQLGYRIWLDDFGGLQDRYFFEMTSTWLEELLYPVINDYFQYIPGLYTNIQNVPFTSTLFMYGNGIYLDVISSQFGPEIVPDIWQEINNRPAFEALDVVLKRKGSSFAETQNEYGKWLYFAGANSLPGAFFKDALLFPELNPVQNYTALKSLNIQDIVNRMAFEIHSITGLENTRFKSDLSGDELDFDEVRFNHFSKNNTETKSVASNLTQIVYPDTSETILLLVSNPTSDNQNFIYSIYQDSTVTTVGPNPIVIKNKQMNPTFFNIPAQGRVYIFSVNGKPVRQLSNNSAFRNEIHWDMRDSNGSLLHSGTYIFVIKGNGTEKMGKFAIVR